MVVLLLLFLGCSQHKDLNILGHKGVSLWNVDSSSVDENIAESFAAEVLKDEDVFIKDQDGGVIGEPLFMNLIRTGNSVIFRFVWHKLQKETKKKSILRTWQIDGQETNAFLEIAQLNYSIIFLIMIRKEICDPEEYNKAFTLKTRDGDNVLDICLQQSKIGLIGGLLTSDVLNLSNKYALLDSAFEKTKIDRIKKCWDNFLTIEKSNAVEVLANVLKCILQISNQLEFEVDLKSSMRNTKSNIEKVCEELIEFVSESVKKLNILDIEDIKDILIEKNLLEEKGLGDDSKERDSSKIFELDLNEINWFRALVYEKWADEPLVKDKLDSNSGAGSVDSGSNTSRINASRLEGRGAQLFLQTPTASKGVIRVYYRGSSTQHANTLGTPNYEQLVQ